MSEHALGLPRVNLPGVAVGALAAALSAAALVRFGAAAEGLVVAGTLVVLVVLSAIDVRERRIPNRIVLPAATVALLAQSVVLPDRWLEWLLAAVLAAAALLAAALVNPKGMGMGDVKLALLLGAVLGAAVVPAFLIAFLLTVPVAAVMFARHGAAARKATLPLGPFLATGAAAVLFLGGPREQPVATPASPSAGAVPVGGGR